MREQRNKISFRGQKIYVGIDVHLKSWSVTVLSETSVLKKFSQHPSPEALYGFLTRSYPGAEYHSVYEAGFCGFWIHERLTALGIDNIVVNPADVPTKSSEKLRKTDTVDSGKLARSLRANELKGIYTPDSVSLEMRSLIRLKNSITKDTTRQKNRLKSQLRYLGIEIPQEFLTPFSNWSKRFFAWLKEIETLTPSGRQALDIHIRHLEELRRQKLEMTRALRTLAKTDRFRDAAVDYERSGVRAGYGNGVPLRDMRHNPLPQCRTTGCLYRNDPDVPLQRRERWDGGYYHTKTRRYAL